MLCVDQTADEGSEQSIPLGCAHDILPETTARLAACSLVRTAGANIATWCRASVASTPLAVFTCRL